MSITINKINKCDNLPKQKLHELADKFNINYQDIENKLQNYDESNKKICSLIKKKYSKINPCGPILYSDTDLTIKKHQMSVANHLVENRGAIVVHSVGTGKTL